MQDKQTVVHKPTGTVKTLNQTHALRLLEYSEKHGRGWELQAEAPKVKKETPKKKKDENIDSSPSTSDS